MDHIEQHQECVVWLWWGLGRWGVWHAACPKPSGRDGGEEDAQVTLALVLLPVSLSAVCVLDGGLETNIIQSPIGLTDCAPYKRRVRLTLGSYSVFSCSFCIIIDIS